MSNAILLHGTGGSDVDYFWFADTKDHLESLGYSVWWPLLPNTDRPELKETRNYIEQNMPTLDENSIIIGHSSACPAILDLLQQEDLMVKQVILVGGFYEEIDKEGASALMLPSSFDWNKLKANAHEYILINSDNDPWGCNDIQARKASLKLGGTLIVPAGQGHMGSISFNQPMKEFDLLKRLIKN